MNLASNSIDDQILNRKIFEEFSGFFAGIILRILMVEVLFTSLSQRNL